MEDNLEKALKQLATIDCEFFPYVNFDVLHYPAFGYNLHIVYGDGDDTDFSQETPICRESLQEIADDIFTLLEQGIFSGLYIDFHGLSIEFEDITFDLEYDSVDEQVDMTRINWKDYLEKSKKIERIREIFNVEYMTDVTTQ